MYLSETRASDKARSEGERPGRRRGLRGLVSANVFALGMTSLITDISSEMVTAVLPVYLVTGLGLSMLQFGFLDGVYSGSTALLRIVGGYLADKFTARKAVAGSGYLMSAVTKLGFPLVGSSVPGIGMMMAVDRAGKGIRTAPRDALISLSTPPESQGRAFGVHRAMDTVGAFIGPVIAFALMSMMSTSLGTAYDAVFVVSFCIGAIGVVALALFVRDPFTRKKTARVAVSLRAGLGMLGNASFRRACIGACLLGLATVSDAFVYLALQNRTDLAISWFPLLPLGTTGVYLLAAVPLGGLADRIGRWKIFLAGHACLIAAYLLIGGVLDLRGTALILVVLALHGLFYAATDGVLMAHAGPLIPEELRTSGLSVLQTTQTLGRSVSSVAFGAAWMRWGPENTIQGFTVALTAAVLLCMVLLRPGAAHGPEVADV
ncbi:MULTISPECIES: MFS transporter [unclassified Streptomyces]|uniref:MFS transporter n=1 Tax=unclassified Streptomyces TaxID=2593676 RepID=UPI0020342CE8|nr:MULTISPECIES: MFS transporter [unclassified Streptomyces]MCM2421049.1 MFS transporter [Streptomyces sp. RKAG293]MCM2426754.1 MFS transporter [Streptomyces sp. RKAG337]